MGMSIRVEIIVTPWAAIGQNLNLSRDVALVHARGAAFFAITKVLSTFIYTSLGVDLLQSCSAYDKNLLSDQIWILPGRNFSVARAAIDNVLLGKRYGYTSYCF